MHLRTLFWEEFIGFTRFPKGSKIESYAMKLCIMFYKAVFCWSRICLPLTSSRVSHVSPLQLHGIHLSCFRVTVYQIFEDSYNVSTGFSSRANHPTFLHLSFKRCATWSTHHSDQLPQHPPRDPPSSCLPLKAWWLYLSKHLEREVLKMGLGICLNSLSTSCSPEL